MEKEEIKKVCTNYFSGEITDIQSCSEGYANQNYAITTSSGKFFFRICKQQSLENIHFELEVLERLKSIDFPAAYPRKRMNDEYISNSEEGFILIYDFIPGHMPILNHESCKEIATAIAQLNAFNKIEGLDKQNSVHIDQCFSLIRKFDQAKIQYPDVFKYFIQETELLNQALRKELPKGLVHGDVFPDNTLFSNNKLKAIIDFEESCIDHLLFDVGIGINGFCFPDNVLDVGLLDTFLNHYNNIRPIGKEEFQLLPEYIIWGAHGMILWHLNHLINRKFSRQLNRVNELIQRVESLHTLNLSF